jgi:hypothetical protein
MSTRVFNLKAKQSTGNVPKGYEFQVVVENKGSVGDTDIRRALEKLGFKAPAAMTSYFEKL